MGSKLDTFGVLNKTSVIYALGTELKIRKIGQCEAEDADVYLITN